MKKSAFVLMCLAVAVGSRVVSADIVTLSNGDKITGKITAITPDAVHVTTPYAGALSLDRKQVKAMYSEAPVPITDAAAAVHNHYVAPTADGNGWKETDAVAAVPPSMLPPLPPPPAAPEPKRASHWLDFGPGWTNQIAIGAMARTGNTESTDLSGEVDLHYLKAPNELTVQVLGQYGTEEGSQTAALADENVVYRRDLSSRWYWYGDEDVRYDGLKGLSIAANASTGPGYFFIKNDRMKLDLRAGPGVIYQKRFDGSTDTDVAGSADLRFQYKLNERIDVYNEEGYNTSLSDSSIFTLTSETAATFKIDVERGLGLKLSFTDQYDNSPSSGRKNNDTRTVLALTLDF